MESMPESLRDILKGRVVLVGVGNPLHGDDGLGPAIIEHVKGNVDAVCIDAGSVPENYAGKILKHKPDSVVIIDAVHLELEPGAYRILGKDDIASAGFTTHTMSLDMFIDYLEKGSRADVYVLAVQPLNVSLGAEMSVPVRKAVEEIAELLRGGADCA